MKFLTLSLCASAVAVKPSFQLGTQIGTAISSGQGYTLGGSAVVHNAKLDAVVAAENKKFSFLNRPTVLNIHVGETRSEAAGTAAERALDEVRLVHASSETVFPWRPKGVTVR